MDLDVVMVADPRFPDGTSTALAAEVRALHGAGYRVGLAALSSPLMPSRRGAHPEVAALLASGALVPVPPGTRAAARLACVHHPTVLSDWPAGPWRIAAQDTVIVAHHPPVDATGAAQYDIARIDTVAGDILGPADWAPVGPAVRRAFAGLPDAPALTAADWVNTLDPSDWPGPRATPLSARVTLGRHSRPGPEKWPDTRDILVQAYPDAPDIRVRLMGWDARLDARFAPRPAGWQVLPFGALPVRRFLTSIDYFAYYHGSSWIEAFGRAPLEAMAAGLPTILPPAFAEVFHDGALYADPAEVADRIRALHADPAAYARQSARAALVAADLYGPARAVARVADRIGAPRFVTAPAPSGAAPARPAPRPEARVLYLTSNGIGMGHLTRCLASARRLPAGVRPVILTMSRAFGVVRDQGIATGYIPYWRSAGLPEGPWQDSLADEIDAAIGFWRPNVVVFDGNVPYPGLMAGLARHPSVWTVWQRRALWRAGTGGVALRDGRAFDAVIEPGEIAAAFDPGPTTALRDAALVVPPITFLRTGEALARTAARAALGLDAARPAVLLQLGSGNNFATTALRTRVIAALRDLPAERRPQIVHADWRISDGAADLPDDVIRLDAFPIARWLAAFDWAVALAGYNTFHENVAAGLPTLFLANENPEQDLQSLRAEVAALRGLGEAAAAGDVQGLLAGIAALADPAERAAVRAACARLPTTNGADDVAAWLGHLALLRKTRGATPPWSPLSPADTADPPPPDAAADPVTDIPVAP